MTVPLSISFIAPAVWFVMPENGVNYFVWFYDRHTKEPEAARALAREMLLGLRDSHVAGALDEFRRRHPDYAVADEGARVGAVRRVFGAGGPCAEHRWVDVPDAREADGAPCPHRYCGRCYLPERL